MLFQNYFCRDRMHRAIWKNMADAKSRQPLADHFRTSPQEISRTFAIICRVSSPQVYFVYYNSEKYNALLYISSTVIVS
jgi:hypothetical protein